MKKLFLLLSFIFLFAFYCQSQTENQAAESKLVEGEKGFSTFRKFDFVQGEKILAIEDFSQDALGDFPDKWNTNSSGELVTIDGKSGKWLNLGKNGVFYPEFITSLPDNFTIQFDVACTPEFSFYSSYLMFSIAALKVPSKDLQLWTRFNEEGREGIEIGIHPKNAEFEPVGMTKFTAFTNNAVSMKNEANLPAFNSENRKFVRVSIWRQKQRLRVYIDQEKIWDLPRVLVEGVKYNSFLFQTDDFHTEADKYYISNIRFAVGSPDTRNKLITEGKFVTSGILFDVNSANIKSESYGVLKNIAQVLQENADVKVKIIGFTDSDGDDASNLKLSKLRAEAVKAILTKEFGINISRMETDGKGELEPISPNTTTINKANNRRVEFVKM